MRPDNMREEDLLGYLLGALEGDDARRVEAALADPGSGPGMRHELDVLRRAVRPLEIDRPAAAAPPGLASRTIRFVMEQTAPATIPLDRGRSTSRPAAAERRDESTWRGSSSRQWLDRAIIAASALAACVLVAPLLLDSIAESRARRAERNLQAIGGSLQGYAQSHRIYPTPPGEGGLSRAGLYAPTLVSEHRLVADDGTVLVPGSQLAREGRFRVPSLEELKAAVGTPRFDELVKSMGGDFGYTLGHRDAAGLLLPNRDSRRAHHPLMADAPAACCEKSDNHPEGIHHVLFEDGHVERLAPDGLHRDDHLYRNHDGEVRAGTDAEDAVIGDSHHQP